MNRARGAIGVLVEIENTKSESVEVFPGGIFATIALNGGEELNPATPLSDARGFVDAGQTRNFLVVFPIIQTQLANINEVTYNLNGLEFVYSDLKNIDDPEG